MPGKIIEESVTQKRHEGEEHWGSRGTNRALENCAWVRLARRSPPQLRKVLRVVPLQRPLLPRFNMVLLSTASGSGATGDSIKSGSENSGKLYMNICRLFLVLIL